VPPIEVPVELDDDEPVVRPVVVLADVPVEFVKVPVVTPVSEFPRLFEG